MQAIHLEVPTYNKVAINFVPFWCLGLCFELTTTFLQAAARWLESTWMGQTNAEVALLKRRSASNCTWEFKFSSLNTENSRILTQACG